MFLRVYTVWIMERASVGLFPAFGENWGARQLWLRNFRACRTQITKNWEEPPRDAQW